LIVLSRQPARAARRYARLARETSFVYGYHGPVTAGLESFCGRPVDRVYSGIASAWSPPGATVSVCQWRRCLQLMVTHVPDAIPPQILDRFLDNLVDDLTTPSALSNNRPARRPSTGSAP
jgi:hypothetical protein